MDTAVEEITKNRLTSREERIMFIIKEAEKSRLTGYIQINFNDGGITTVNRHELIK